MTGSLTAYPPATGTAAVGAAVSVGVTFTGVLVATGLVVYVRPSGPVKVICEDLVTELYVAVSDFTVTLNDCAGLVPL